MLDHLVDSSTRHASSEVVIEILEEAGFLNVSFSRIEGLVTFETDDGRRGVVCLQEECECKGWWIDTKGVQG